MGKEDFAPYTDVSGYRRLVGQLLYLTNNRPDKVFAVSQLSKILNCPMIEYHQAALRVLRYIKSAPAKGLLFVVNSDFKLIGFSDSDWGSCLDTSR